MVKKPDFEHAKTEVTKHAKEVLEQLYKTLVEAPPFTLSDGSMAKVETYIVPEIGEDGQATCGFDVRLHDGSHLEFTVENTGWGKSFAEALAKTTAKQASSRRP